MLTQSVSSIFTELFLLKFFISVYKIRFLCIRCFFTVPW